MKILVTGGTGFIGKSLVSLLLSSGHDLTVLSRYRFDTEGYFQQVHGSLHDERCFDSLVQRDCKFDAVLHLATCRYSENPTEYLNTNCLGTINLLNLVRDCQIPRFINISGLTVIGKPLYSPIDELHPCNPTSLYLTSKLISERLVHTSATPDCSKITLRLTAPIGDHMPTNRYLMASIRSALKGTPVTVFGQGTRRQNYIDVLDVYRCIVLALDSSLEGTYIVGGANSYSNNEVAEIILSELKSRSSITHVKQLDEEEGFDWSVNISLAKKNLGYLPKYSLVDTIKRIASSY
jgi:UDP-glucose 4-epimerase